MKAEKYRRILFTTMIAFKGGHIWFAPPAIIGITKQNRYFKNSLKEIGVVVNIIEPRKHELVIKVNIEV